MNFFFRLYGKQSNKKLNISFFFPSICKIDWNKFVKFKEKIQKKIETQKRTKKKNKYFSVNVIQVKFLFLISKGNKEIDVKKNYFTKKTEINL